MDGTVWPPAVGHGGDAALMARISETAATVYARGYREQQRPRARLAARHRGSNDSLQWLGWPAHGGTGGGWTARPFTPHPTGGTRSAQDRGPGRGARHAVLAGDDGAPQGDAAPRRPTGARVRGGGGGGGGVGGPAADHQPGQ